ncbi:MarR family transcriptional regulator [Candidatus Woesearchaeota archaeon]|nr:MAG: MarR family transcriptional regulator [Candidatus Woesearchaeota archaeon]
MEVQFACKRFPIAQVLRCSFNLTLTEYEVLKLLMRGERSVEELAQRLGKDRTTVQRAIKPLIAKGLVRRRQYNLSGGGYQFFYSAVGKERIKQRVNEHFEHFTRTVRAEIENW